MEPLHYPNQLAKMYAPNFCNILTYRKVYHGEQSTESIPNDRVHFFMSTMNSFHPASVASKSMPQLSKTRYKADDFVILEDKNGLQFDSAKIPDQVKPHLRSIDFTKEMDR